MPERDADISTAYRTLLILWVAFAGFQIFLFSLAWVSKPEAFSVDRSKPLLGDYQVLIILVSVFGIYGLIRSVQLHTKYIKKAVAEKKSEFVQTALIVGAALAMSVSLWGVFLAYAIEYQYSFIWMMAGLAATCLHFPRRRDLEDAWMTS